MNDLDRLLELRQNKIRLQFEYRWTVELEQEYQSLYAKLKDMIDEIQKERNK